MAVCLSACEHVGPVNIGDMSQARATMLARAEWDRRHGESIAGWRADVADYGNFWVVTFHRPVEPERLGQHYIGNSFHRVSLDKHSGKIVSVMSDE
jgi:hypothetical protein